MFKYEFPAISYRFSPSVGEYRTFSTQQLRDSFLIESLFAADEVILHATDLDRAIAGGIMPVEGSLKIGSIDALRCDYFFERREGGVINVGGAGAIEVDGTRYEVGKCECLYIGRGSKEVVFTSADKENPAAFYLLSYPAHKEYPTTLATKADANRLELGAKETCNERTLYQYIHENGIKSCQLVMGFTELAVGSVWNTMPSHTHFRRSEIYLYFDVTPENQVLHLMGQPDETRPLWIKNRQAALSPSWSIHSGAGTAAYSFIWGMGGENQRFDDMDGFPISDLK